MKRLAIAMLVVALSFGIALAQDKPATDKPAAPPTTEKAKDAGCGESAGCCGEMKNSKGKKAMKGQKSPTKTAEKTAKPEKVN